jgi:hypothetical protein
MSIDVELALILGLFLIGAVVLAIDNLVYAMSRRLSRWLRNRKSLSTPPVSQFDSEKTAVTTRRSALSFNLVPAKNRSPATVGRFLLCVRFQLHAPLRFKRRHR